MDGQPKGADGCGFFFCPPSFRIREELWHITVGIRVNVDRERSIATVINLTVNTFPSNSAHSVSFGHFTRILWIIRLFYAMYLSSSYGLMRKLTQWRPDSSIDLTLGRPIVKGSAEDIVGFRVHRLERNLLQSIYRMDVLYGGAHRQESPRIRYLLSCRVLECGHRCVR